MECCQGHLHPAPKSLQERGSCTGTAPQITIISTPKCLVLTHLTHPPSGSQLHSQCCPCPRRRLQHLEQGTSLNSNIPQGKSTRAPPALCTTQKLIFTAPLKPQSAKPCTSLGQGHTQGTNTSPAPLPSPLGHPNTSQRAVKGATATQPAQGWGIKINIHLGISETGNAGNAVMEFMGKYPGFCSLVLTTAGQAFSCLNITARTSG